MYDKGTTERILRSENEGGKNTMRKFLATLLALVMTLALMVPAS